MFFVDDALARLMNYVQAEENYMIQRPSPL